MLLSFEPSSCSLFYPSIPAWLGLWFSVVVLACLASSRGESFGGTGGYGGRGGGRWARSVAVPPLRLYSTSRRRTASLLVPVRHPLSLARGSTSAHHSGASTMAVNEPPPQYMRYIYSQPAPGARDIGRETKPKPYQPATQITRTALDFEASVLLSGAVARRLLHPRMCRQLENKARSSAWARLTGFMHACIPSTAGLQGRVPELPRAVEPAQPLPECCHERRRARLQGPGEAPAAAL